VQRAERSSTDLAADIVHDAQELVRLEIELAKQEAKELAIRNGVAVGLLTFGGLLLMLALLVGIPVLVVSWIPNHVVAAAVWVGAYVVLGALLAAIGRLLLRLEPPPRTLASLRETRAWALRQISSNDR
jgi:hypothetical protein